jgi:hypothetical protein
VAEEADECLDWLEYLRDADILSDPVLTDEACQLTKIFTASLRTARANTNRIKNFPKG